MVKKGKADALITLCGTRGDWTQSGNEVVLTLEIKIFVKAGNPKIHQLEGVKKLDDLKPFRLIDYAGNSWCQKKLIDRNFKVDLAPNKNAIFPMLIKERGDANLCNSMTGRYFIKKSGLKDQIVELPPVLEKVPFHLCVGKKISSYKNYPRV